MSYWLGKWFYGLEVALHNRGDEPAQFLERLQMSRMKIGQFAIFDGEIGIITGIDVPIDINGKPTTANVVLVKADGTSDETPHGEVAQYAVEFHSLILEGDTKMRLLQDDKGNPLKVETDIKYLVGDAINLLELLEPNDERIPESRRTIS